MAKKPTYEELKQRFKELEKEILKLKKAEEERNKFIKAIETIKEAINITTTDTVMIYTNDAMDELFGYKKGELIGKHVSILNADPPSKAKELPKQISDAIKKKRVWEGEIHNKRKDGTEFISYATIAALTDKDGKIISYVSTQHDITEQVRAEEELKVQAKILENMAEGVNLSDEKGAIFFTNPNFDSMFGYKRGELIGKNVSVLNSFSPKENARFVAEVIKQLKTKGSWFREVSNIKKDGTQFITYARVSALEISGKLCLISVQEDITDRKQVEETLQRAHDELERSVEERTAELAKANEELHAEITEHKQADEALRESEERLRGFMESATDVFSICDPELNFVEINEAGMKFFPPGTKKEDVIGKNFIPASLISTKLE